MDEVEEVGTRRVEDGRGDGQLQGGVNKEACGRLVGTEGELRVLEGAVGFAGKVISLAEVSIIPNHLRSLGS